MNQRLQRSKPCWHSHFTGCFIGTIWIPITWLTWIPIPELYNALALDLFWSKTSSLYSSNIAIRWIYHTFGWMLPWEARANEIEHWLSAACAGISLLDNCWKSQLQNMFSLDFLLSFAWPLVQSILLMYHSQQVTKCWRMQPQKRRNQLLSSTMVHS